MHDTPQVSSSDIESAYCKVIKAMPDIAVLMPRDPYRLKDGFSMQLSRKLSDLLKHFWQTCKGRLEAARRSHKGCISLCQHQLR